VDSDKAVYGAIDGMLRTLDPHSKFFDPKAFNSFVRTRGVNTTASASRSRRVLARSRLSPLHSRFSRREGRPARW
jgi:carboxyl-terminal processing protease